MSQINIGLRKLRELKFTIGLFQKKELPFAMALAANQMGFELRDKVSHLITTSFNAKKYTINSPRFGVPSPSRSGFRPIKKQDITSGKIPAFYFLINDDGVPPKTPADYLAPHVSGGAAVVTPFQKRLQRYGLLRPGQHAIPSPGAPGRRNAQGKLAPSEYVKAGFGLKINSIYDYSTMRRIYQPPSGYKQPRVKKNTYYFSLPLSMKGHGLRPGIYVRNKISKELSRVFNYAEDVSFPKRSSFPYIETVKGSAPILYERNLLRALDKYSRLRI